MTNIKNFNDLISHLVKRGTRKRVAIVWAADESTQYAAIRALNDGFIDAIFVGCREQLEQLELLKPHAEHISYVDTDDKDKAAALAVELVRDGKADVLMKGLINTDNLLKAILNKVKYVGGTPYRYTVTHNPRFLVTITCYSSPTQLSFPAPLASSASNRFAMWLTCAAPSASPSPRLRSSTAARRSTRSTSRSLSSIANWFRCARTASLVLASLTVRLM